MTQLEQCEHMERPRRALWPNYPYPKHVRCVHIGSECVFELIDNVNMQTPDMQYGGEHLYRYVKALRPDGHFSWFRVEGTWEQAIDAMTEGRLYDFGYHWYEQRIVRETSKWGT